MISPFICTDVLGFIPFLQKIGGKTTNIEYEFPTISIVSFIFPSQIYLLPVRTPENKRRTKTITKTLNPEWNQTLVYAPVLSSELPFKTMEFTVWNYDRFKPNDFLGEVIIDMAESPVLDGKARWFKLHRQGGRQPFLPLNQRRI